MLVTAVLVVTLGRLGDMYGRVFWLAIAMAVVGAAASLIRGKEAPVSEA